MSRRLQWTVFATLVATVLVSAGCGGPELVGFVRDQDDHRFKIETFLIENRSDNAYGDLVAHMEGTREIRVDENTARFLPFKLSVPLEDVVIGPRERKAVPVEDVEVPGRVHIDKSIWYFSEFEKKPWPRAGNAKHGAGNSERGTRNAERGAGNGELKTFGW